MAGKICDRPHQSCSHLHHLPFSLWQAPQVSVLVFSPPPGLTWWRLGCELAAPQKKKQKQNSKCKRKSQDNTVNELRWTWKQLLPDEVWRSGRAAGEALSSLGSAQTRWSAAPAAAGGERCMTAASSSGSTLQTPPTLWDTSTPAGKKQPT